MKIKFVLLLAIVIAGVAYVTKPSDKDCITKFATETIGNSYISDIIADNTLVVTALEVKDHTFYKTVNLRLTDKELATCIFGKIILSKDVKKN